MPTLGRILEYFEQRNAPFELIVVDDGSTDGTANAAAQVWGARPNCRLLALPHNRGKGAAIRRGVQEATGEVILFSDADLSTPIEEFEKLHSALAAGADIAIGSRALPTSQVEIHQPWYRERMGKTFNLLVRAILWLGIHDTQCGFKAFRREPARRLTVLQRVDGWAFDAELLFLAKRLNYRVAEVPVRWRNDPGTKVGIVRSSWQMLWDIVKVRLRAMACKYTPQHSENER